MATCRQTVEVFTPRLSTALQPMATIRLISYREDNGKPHEHPRSRSTCEETLLTISSQLGLYIPSNGFVSLKPIPQKIDLHVRSCTGAYVLGDRICVIHWFDYHETPSTPELGSAR